MDAFYPVCRSDNRSLDGFDLITVLGLMKEYNLQEIWRRYLASDARGPNISMYVETEKYFIEMHLQEMRRIILSEKFNTNPFFMQQVVQRLIANHPHELIVEKIQHQGIDAGDNPISLSCSMGNTIIDLIVNKNEPFSKESKRSYGSTPVEKEERRPIDIYDLSSTLYLCQQNLTETIFRRYTDTEPGKKATSRSEVNLDAKVGNYRVTLTFHCVSTRESRTVPPPGNASAQTIHQALQRMNFRHAPTLVLKELKDVGLTINLEQVISNFVLRRYINNTALKLEFTNMS
jgi:hypothetical protein